MGDSPNDVHGRPSFLQTLTSASDRSASAHTRAEHINTWQLAQQLLASPTLVSRRILVERRKGSKATRRGAHTTTKLPGQLQRSEIAAKRFCASYALRCSRIDLGCNGPALNLGLRPLRFHPLGHGEETARDRRKVLCGRRGARNERIYVSYPVTSQRERQKEELFLRCALLRHARHPHTILRVPNRSVLTIRDRRTASSEPWLG